MADQPSREAEQPTFEQALARLETVVRDLEEGQIGLDEALARYVQGVKLLGHCQTLLDRAERKIALVSGLDADGKPVCTPLDDAVLSLEEKARTRSRRRTSPERGTSSSSGKTPGEDSEIDVPDGPL